ncbi:NADPH-dependent FMN reductase [Streptomyces sp. bgisy100]|uniref:NADPH-dependent FMN reductase n=1 Tax=Streptomyces sp. bgisy100 TaxID=3413783 RepID=UPI003D7208BF
MPETPLQLAVIIGSVREGRFGPTVAHWFARRAEPRNDMTVDVIDLAESPHAEGSQAAATTDRRRTAEDRRTDEDPRTTEDRRPAEDPRTTEAPEETAVTPVELSSRLAAADAFVVVTPEYNHSFPAALKHALDGHGTEWRAKPVGFVSYGGISGGLRAVEQLRQVFAELHATTVRETVSFHNVWDRFGADGLPLDEAGPDGAATAMLDQLAWWAHALRDARTARPYGS